LPSFQASTASAAALAQLGLYSRVQARLLCHADTANLGADVEVDPGTGRVKLLGRLSTADLARATSLIRQVPGVTSVEA
jgi:osmotically-inducible protein OsmY